MTSWKAWAARAACVLICIGAAQPFYFRMLTAQREWYGQLVTSLAARRTPTLRPFMEGVREHTQPGDRIAIAVPYREWDAGYGYTFYIATYVLAGRTTIPLVPRKDIPATGSLDEADYVACWHVRATMHNFTPVWSSPDGTLFRRKR